MSRCDALVFFGASGDLAKKKVLPALYRLVVRGRLDAPIIGAAKSGWDRARMVERVRESVHREEPAVDSAALERMTSLLSYVDGDYTDPATFTELRRALGSARRPLFYMAIPPDLFDDVVQALDRSDCKRDGRLLVEKPFGRDLASAQQLNRTILQVFDERCVFRIDHYLGKESVENLSYFRFANSLFEPIWHRHYISNVQVTNAEAFGMEGRGAFYDRVGAVRDVLQNHMLQVVATLAMEPPPRGGSLPEERARLIRAVKPLRPADVVRGQYAGYRQEPGVLPDSETETYCAVRLFIDNSRWAGVPFFIRTGKRLPKSVTEARVAFKRPPRPALGDVIPPGATYLRYRLDPDVTIGLGMRTKRPGTEMEGQAIELVCHSDTSGDMTPYERLIGDALEGHEDLFALEQDVEAEWRVVNRIVKEPSSLHTYAAGTWGPEAAAQLLSGFEQWHTPSVD